MPLTNGAAFEVPLVERYMPGEPTHPATTSDPGAKRSTHGPKFEYDARRSARSMAATTIADVSDAGEYEHASRF